MADDILLDENFDLLEDGDEWVEEEGDDIDVELILLANKGENREAPTVGFGINKRLKARLNAQGFERDMKIELESGGFKNPTIIFGDTVIDFKVIV